MRPGEAPRSPVAAVVILAVLVAAVLTACGSDGPTAHADDAGPLPPGVRVPLTDMGARTYLTFPGGIFPGGNTMPVAHATAGAVRAAAIARRDSAGALSASGQYVLLSIGMSNTTQEFSSFMSLAAADPAADASRLALADGAAGGRTASQWTSVTSIEYDRIRDVVLGPRGLGERQVAAVWLKVANPGPTRGLPDPRPTRIHCSDRWARSSARSGPATRTCNKSSSRVVSTRDTPRRRSTPSHTRTRVGSR